MMIKPLNRTLRMGLLCLLALSAAACQNQNRANPP